MSDELGDGLTYNLPNNLKMPNYWDTLDWKLASRSSYSSLIHQFYDLTTTRLRTQPCALRLIDECQVGTLIRRSLLKRDVLCKSKQEWQIKFDFSFKFIPDGNSCLLIFQGSSNNSFRCCLLQNINLIVIIALACLRGSLQKGDNIICLWFLHQMIIIFVGN